MGEINRPVGLVSSDFKLNGKRLVFKNDKIRSSLFSIKLQLKLG